tara:strand:- start:66 stop:905 length:840 start_codon:yes stop_codon:yes gene_type:complete
MAKKQTAAKAAPKQEVEVPVVETPVVEAPKPKKTEPKKPDWEIKDRVYYLTRHRTALSYSIKSSGLYFFDKEKGYEREIKYCENQRTPFVDEMQGDQRLSHIMFRNGALYVPKNKVMLQKFLSIYHPLADVLFYEYKPTKVAESQLDVLEMEADALILARSLDIDKMEAIMRVELGSKVSDMSSKELKRDCLVFAKRNPYLFLELLEDDNVELRNFGIKATEARIIELSTDQRTFSWVTNGRKLMTVPFDEHPYSALAAWFKTDEGMEIYSNIEKRLNM